MYEPAYTANPYLYILWDNTLYLKSISIKETFGYIIYPFYYLNLVQISDTFLSMRLGPQIIAQQEGKRTGASYAQRFTACLV